MSGKLAAESHTSRPKTIQFGLAPMEGVSEFPFRLWMAQVSQPAFSCSPFLRATDSYPATIPEDFAPEVFAGLDLEYDFIPQVMAAKPEDFIRTARLLLPQAPFVDLNCGCPSPNPVSGGAGSSLLRDPKHFINFIEQICDALPDRALSVKMRLGFESSSYFLEMITALKKMPLRQLTIHGRTRSDRYDGLSRWDLIQTAAANLPFPVVGSGDILGRESMERIVNEAPAVECMIIGRGALRNPWIFQELNQEQPVQLKRSVLQCALACFALLTELSLDHQAHRLIKMVRLGLWKQTAGTDLLAWSYLYEQLSYAVSGKITPWGQLELNRITLGRVKMLWNSLRSSLPAAYFAPTLLRAKHIAELLDHLAILDPADEGTVIGHRSELDWLYTSSRVKPQSVATIETN